MGEFNLVNVSAGLLAYVLAIVVGAGPLVYVLFRFHVWSTRRLDEEAQVRAGNRSVAIELGTTIFCQALLARHAVYAMMAVVRSLFAEEFTTEEFWGIVGRASLFVPIIAGLAVASVRFAAWVFRKMTLKLSEEEAIKQNNLAMAFFYALVLLSITVVLNEGMEEFSRSLIPFGRTGLQGVP